MKTITKIIASILLLNVSLLHAQDKIVVNGEKKPNVDFTKYKTYNWVSEADRNPDLILYSYEEYEYPAKGESRTTGKKKSKVKHENPIKVYSYSYLIPSNDPGVNTTVLNATEAELEGRGYKKDEGNPDLLVAYKILDRSTKIKGYDAAPTVVGATETYQPKDTVTYHLKPGSIMISIIDKKTGSAIWEGFASGVGKDNGYINDKQEIREAINLIFQKYEWRGDDVSMN